MSLKIDKDSAEAFTHQDWLSMIDKHNALTDEFLRYKTEQTRKVNNLQAQISNLRRDLYLVAS